jgi:predicted SAM-dependent methyltransferase
MFFASRRVAARASDALIGAWSWLRRGRRVKVGAAPVKVNVGSGLVVAPGWLNIDVSLVTLAASWPAPLQRLLYRLLPPTSAASRDYAFEQFRSVLRGNRFIHHRIEFGLPFADGTVDYIYTSHFVEHLYRSHASAFFAESHRVLRGGGVLRVCVPDLNHALSLFRDGRKEEALVFFFDDVGPSEYTRHRYMYDFDLLRSELMRAGFRDVRRRSCGEGEVPDSALLDNRPEQTLFVEASK